MAEMDFPSAQDTSVFNPTSQNSNSTDQTLNPMDIDRNDLTAEQPLLETRDPAQRDVSLREFLSKMDEYAPIIPEAVTEHFLALAGLPPSSTPLPISRLLALATQKFIADIAADAYQYSRMRSSTSGAGPSNATAAAAAAAGAVTGPPGASQQAQQQQQKEEKGKAGAHVLGVQRPGFGGGGGGGGGAGQGGAVLTMEDLGCAVGEYGVNVRRGEYYR